MPTPYRGKLKMSCSLETCEQDKARGDVIPQCLACSRALIEILDLDDHRIAHKPKPAATDAAPDPQPEDDPAATAPEKKRHPKKED